MPLIISVFLLAVGQAGAEAWQKLSCPLEEQHRGLLMVWCRRTSWDCCTGFSFGPGEALLDRGRLRVTLSPDSLSVEVLEPNLDLGEGMYWCGRLGGNGTIIKLAEVRIYSSFASYLWSMARWTLIPLLPLVVILINCILDRTAPKAIRKRAMDLQDDAVASRNTSQR